MIAEYVYEYAQNKLSKISLFWWGELEETYTFEYQGSAKPTRITYSPSIWKTHSKEFALIHPLNAFDGLLENIPSDAKNDGDVVFDFQWANGNFTTVTQTASQAGATMTAVVQYMYDNKKAPQCFIPYPIGLYFMYLENNYTKIDVTISMTYGGETITQTDIVNLTHTYNSYGYPSMSVATGNSGSSSAIYEYEEY